METKVTFYLKVTAEIGKEEEAATVIKEAIQLLEDDAFDVEELTDSRKIERSKQ